MEHLPTNMLLPTLIIVTSLLSTAVAIIAYFLKEMRAAQKERDNKQDDAIKDVNEDVKALRNYVLKECVDKDSFVRAVAGVEHKVDCIFDEIKEINKNLHKLIGVNVKNG